MNIEDIRYNGKHMAYYRKHNAVFIYGFNGKVDDEQHTIRFYYSGQPIIAKMPPWDGGFVWSSDSLGNPWVGVACEGTGASLWWPNKDHLSDEPDSMNITVTVPDSLMCVSNGTLIKKDVIPENKMRFAWKVHYPINNYNVTINIAKYDQFRDEYKRKDGSALELEYFVLSYNRKRAEEHFKQVHKMMDCFEGFFGEYPYPKDGYALVETPYWGMEHQSAIAYGNNYKNLKYGFDFIIIHETGHEWWGNSVSCGDHAELWIHESLTTYAEALYLECRFDKETAHKYMNGQRMKIKNKMAILGVKGVNFNEWPHADMYYKGAWMWHSLRNTIRDDERWFKMIKEFRETYHNKIVDTERVVEYFTKHSGMNLHPIFDHFLNHKEAPVLGIQTINSEKGTLLKYRWVNTKPVFNMPIAIETTNEQLLLFPTKEWKEVELKSPFKQFDHDQFYYILNKQE